MSTDLTHAAMATWAAKDLPARLQAAQVAKILNCSTDDVAVLTGAGTLRPLGRPKPNAVKYFSTIELITLLADREWLDDVTKTIGQYWRKKNARRSGTLTEIEASTASNDRSARVEKPSTISSTISSITELKPSAQRVNSGSESVVSKVA